MAEEVKNSKVSEKGKKFSKFFNDIRLELKRVVWPDRKQLINNTVTVLMSCLVIGLLIWCFDLGLQQLDKLVFIKNA